MKPIDADAMIRYISNLERDDEDQFFTFSDIKKIFRDAPAIKIITEDELQSEIAYVLKRNENSLYALKSELDAIYSRYIELLHTVAENKSLEPIKLEVSATNSILWISCNSKLPDTNKPVLCYCPVRNVKYVVAQYTGNEFIECYSGDRIAYVTRWMPLPTLPEVISNGTG